MSVRIGMGPGLGTVLAPQDCWRWIDFCEDSGIDSIWYSDQLLGPTLEPVAMMAALAARTWRMRFGTNALVLPFRDPIVLAKQFAVIDFLSEGRLLPVFGVGNASDPYWAATETATGGRGSRANEAIALVRMLLEEEHVEFAGAHFRYHGPGAYPRPAKPIPLWIGGQSQAAIDRTVAFGDGWLGGLIGPEEAGAAKRGIEVALSGSGRTIDADHYGVSLPLRIGSESDPAVIAARERLLGRLPEEQRASIEASFAIGPAEEIVELLRRYVAAGMSKFVALPIAADAADLIEQTKLLIRNIIPQIED